MDFGGAGKWIRLAIDETGGRAAVKSVAVKGSGSSSWTEMTNSWGATWEHPSAPAPPLSFKVGLRWRCALRCLCLLAGWLAGSEAIPHPLPVFNP